MAKKTKVKTEMSLKYINDDFVSLNRNGSDLLCPFAPVVPLQNKTGNTIEIAYSRSSCTSLCPLFQILKDGKEVKLHCGTPMLHAIDKIIPIQDTLKPTDKGIVMTMNKDVN